MFLEYERLSLKHTVSDLEINCISYYLHVGDNTNMSTFNYSCLQPILLSKQFRQQPVKNKLDIDLTEELPLQDIWRYNNTRLDRDNKLMQAINVDSLRSLSHKYILTSNAFETTRASVNVVMYFPHCQAISSNVYFLVTYWNVSELEC